MNASKCLDGTALRKGYTPLVTNDEAISSQTQLALLSSRPFFTLLWDAKLSHLSNIDVSGTMSVSKSNLFPILPYTIRDSRYQSLVRVRILPTIVPQGANMISAPSYQSQGWTISDHPEGKRYAQSKTQSGITIVTEARVADPGVSDQLNAWVAVICDMITEENVQFQETSHLFLEIHENSGTCNYYFADHGLRTIFWLQSVDTISVRLPNSLSSDHLQYSLEENYWIHVELFPETASQYSAIALNELQVSFLHARADALTSNEPITPSFPYTAEQSQKFIELLQCSQGHASSPYVTTFVARLWATIMNHRFFICAGEDLYRLSSDQCVLERPDSERGWLSTMISKALFGIPDVHRGEIETLWVDQLAYSSFHLASWRKHISNTAEDLKQKMSWTFTLLGLNVAVMSIPASHALTKASLLLGFLGLSIAFFLLQVQQSLIDADAATAAKYLKDWNTRYGFLPIAIVHSLPQALFIWAFLLLAIQGFWMTFADLPLPLILATFLPVAAMLVIAFVVIRKAVYPRQKVVKDPAPQAPIPLSSLSFCTATTS
ncbi:hypothetical protein V8E53_010437 [Lactarius tabidus]